MGLREDERARLEVYRHSFLGRVAHHEAATDLRQPVQWHAGVIVDDVQLAGEYPKTVLVIDFRWAERPSCRFAWHTFLWAVSPDAPDDQLAFADNWLAFVEYVDAIASTRKRLPCHTEPHHLGATEAVGAAISWPTPHI